MTDMREVWQKAVAETNRLQRELDITSADHIALWLEANTIPDEPMSQCASWLAVQIVEAHERALFLMQPEIDRRVAEERAKLLGRLREPSEENAREWFHVVVMDDETYGIKDNGGSMSFPWSKDRADTWLLKDAINRAIDFSVRQKSLVPPSSGHLPPEKENSDEQF